MVIYCYPEFGFVARFRQCTVGMYRPCVHLSLGSSYPKQIIVLYYFCPTVIIIYGPGFSLVSSLSVQFSFGHKKRGQYICLPCFVEQRKETSQGLKNLDWQSFLYKIIFKQSILPSSHVLSMSTYK